MRDYIFVLLLVLGSEMYIAQSGCIDKCIDSKEIENHILEGRIDAVKKFKINATPTLIINNEKFDKPITFKNLKKVLEKLI